MVWKCKKCNSTKRLSYKDLCGSCYTKQDYVKNKNRYKESRAEYYQKNKDKIKQSQIEWGKKNKDKKNEMMKKLYHKNKDKWICRVKTRKIFIKNPHLFILKCRNCNKKEDLEIHHEIYNNDNKKIIEDIKEGKIYLLCYSCHKITFR